MSQQQRSVSRRDFLKLVGGATAAVAVAGAVPAALDAEGAFALPRAYAAPQAGVAAAGTAYTVTANLYADKKDTPIGKNAYVTNPGDPPANKPVKPVSDNATLTMTAEGRKLLTVPIVNNTFGVLSIADVSVDGKVKVTDVQMGTWNPPFLGWGTPYAERIVSITFDVTDFAGGDAIATFSPCKEYAAFLPYKGDKGWDLHLIADLSAVR